MNKVTIFKYEKYIAFGIDLSAGAVVLCAGQ